MRGMTLGSVMLITHRLDGQDGGEERDGVPGDDVHADLTVCRTSSAI